MAYISAARFEVGICYVTRVGQGRGQRDARSLRTDGEDERMNDEILEELGPIDFLVVEFPVDKADFSGAMAAELKKLVEAGSVRVLDMIFLKKDGDGSFEAFEAHEYVDDEVGALREFGAEMAELLAEEDVNSIAEALEPETVAAILVWENTWAAPFAASIRRSGGQLVANGRIPMQAIVAALQDDETEGA